MINDVLNAYFEIFTKEYFLLLMGMGIVCIILIVIYNSFK